jgi:hypothetical protein
MQVSAILNSRSRFHRGSIHATASALNSSSQSARFNSSRHPESSTRGNARIAAHKSCPNAPVLSTWRCRLKTDRDCALGTAIVFRCSYFTACKADNALVWMTPLAAPNECVYLNGCDLLRFERTDAGGAGRSLQFFRLIAPIRWLPNPKTRADLPCVGLFPSGVRG